MPIAEKVAIVTGAARGIGLAVTRKFLAAGYAVSLWDIDADTLRTTAATLSRERSLAVECDVSDPVSVQAAIEAVDERFGRIDALVNNAGIAIFKPLLDTTFDEWSRVLATNLNGPFICTLACARARCAWPMARARPR
jgi:meso-butanediol dehydrogenase/(S,S)-butanediol dehydrogenase/diacetyl reductase